MSPCGRNIILCGLRDHFFRFFLGRFVWTKTTMWTHFLTEFLLRFKTRFNLHSDCKSFFFCKDINNLFSTAFYGEPRSFIIFFSPVERKRHFSQEKNLHYLEEQFTFVVDGAVSYLMSKRTGLKYYTVLIHDFPYIASVTSDEDAKGLSGTSEKKPETSFSANCKC